MIATPVLGPNGMTNVTFNVPTVIMPPVVDIQNNSMQAHQGSPTAAAKGAAIPSTANTSKEELPLDLSKKNSESSTKKHGARIETVSSPDDSLHKEMEEQPEDLSTKASKSPVQSLPSRPSTPISQSGSHRSSPSCSRLEPPMQTHPAMPNAALMAAAAAVMLPQQAAAFHASCTTRCSINGSH